MITTIMIWKNSDAASGTMQSNAEKYLKLSELCRDEKTNGKALVGPGFQARRTWNSVESAKEWGDFMVALAIKHGFAPPEYSIVEE